MNIEGGRLEAEALRILRQLPGVAVVEEEPGGRDRGADAILRFAGTRAPVAVEFKRRANAAAAWQLVQYAEGHPEMPGDPYRRRDDRSLNLLNPACFYVLGRLPEPPPEVTSVRV